MDLKNIPFAFDIDTCTNNIDNFCKWMNYEEYYAYDVNPDTIKKHLYFYTIYLQLKKQETLSSFIPYNNGVKKKKNIISFINNKNLTELSPTELREIIVYGTNITLEKLKTQNKSKKKLIKQINNIVKNIKR